MPDEDKEQRTEQATPKRQRESREKGRVPKSREVSSVLVMIGSLLIFYFIGIESCKNMMNLTSSVFIRSAHLALSRDSVNNLFQELIWRFFIIVSPVMIAAFVFGLMSSIMQTGGLIFSSEGLNLQFSKIDPIKGFGRLFSKQSLAELIKSITKIIVVGYIAYVTVKGELSNIPHLANLDMLQILTYIGSVSFKIFFRTILVLAVLAVIDYAFQKYDHEQSIKMTKEEVKKEQKEAEGYPQIKARVRSVQRDMARRRMMKAVPEADVVITNPLKLAVALKYDRGKMIAPTVVAMGAGYVAERIREIAGRENVPVVENKPLAQMLHKFVKVGEIIPDRFYKAVAEILAYVYRLKGKTG